MKATISKRHIWISGFGELMDFLCIIAQIYYSLNSVGYTKEILLALSIRHHIFGCCPKSLFIFIFSDK